MTQTFYVVSSWTSLQIYIQISYMHDIFKENIFLMTFQDAQDRIFWWLDNGLNQVFLLFDLFFITKEGGSLM